MCEYCEDKVPTVLLTLELFEEDEVVEVFIEDHRRLVGMIDSYTGLKDSIKINYCPMCGRRL